MFDMESQRVDYLSQLRPDPDFVLNQAVCTTYSLELGALLGACLSMGDMDFSGDLTQTNQINLFAFAKEMRDKVSVFCEKGRIKHDNQTNGLCVLLEGMVHQVVVREPKNLGNSLSSFHAKTWILDYTSRESPEHRYRLIVLSRNLTFDSSWDMAVRLDGVEVDEPVSSSEGIVRLLSYLRGNKGTECDIATVKRIKSLEKALSKVQFSVDDHTFDDFELLPFGPSGTGLLSAKEASLFRDAHERAMVISPFLSNGGPLEQLSSLSTGKRGESSSLPFLLSREESLIRLKPSISASFQCYVPKPWLADVSIENEAGEDATHEALASRYADLHAKVYLVKDANREDLYIGSLNASRNGMYGNVETLIRLHVRQRMLPFEKAVSELVGDEKPFTAWEPSSETGDDGGDYENTELEDRQFHTAAKLFVIDNVRVTVSNERGAKRYSLSVGYSLKCPDEITQAVTIRIAPYLSKNLSAIVDGSEVTFGPLSSSQVSEFFILSASWPDGYSTSCLLCCPDDVFHDECLSSDERQRIELERILDADDDALAAYIAFAFGIQSGTGAPSGEVAPGGSELSQHLAPIGAGMYELLLRDLSTANDAEAQLRRARERLEFLPKKYDDERVEAMRHMIDEFESAVKRNGK